ncbi:MAG: hypothetical protein ABI947_15310 [Chloroflexota bacterium]
METPLEPPDDTPAEEQHEQDTIPEPANSLDDTKPVQHVVMEGEPPVSEDDTKPTHHLMFEAEPAIAQDDTKPRRLLPKKYVPNNRRPAYPDPDNPYAGLFPPPKPDDADYFESDFAQGDTPPSGTTPVNRAFNGNDQAEQHDEPQENEVESDSPDN